MKHSILTNKRQYSLEKLNTCGHCESLVRKEGCYNLNFSPCFSSLMAAGLLHLMTDITHMSDRSIMAVMDLDLFSCSHDYTRNCRKEKKKNIMCHFPPSMDLKVCERAQTMKYAVKKLFVFPSIQLLSKYCFQNFHSVIVSNFHGKYQLSIF